MSLFFSLAVLYTYLYTCVFGIQQNVTHVTMLCIAVLHMVNCGMCTADCTHVLLVIISVPVCFCYKNLHNKVKLAHYQIRSQSSLHRNWNGNTHCCMGLSESV